MPQSTPERRKRWGISTEKAIQFLENKGYMLNKDWSWKPPYKVRGESFGPLPSLDETDAILYLIQEWDFNGLEEA